MDRIDDAFAAVGRRGFLPPPVADQADLDMPLPIGHGVTNSQPTTVRLMLQWLDVRPGDKVLDVGAGSGWTTALLAYLTGKRGTVTATELIPELVKFGQSNVGRAGFSNATFYQAKPGVFGWPQGGPYSRILVSAAADEVPQDLTDQLKTGGRMVIPVKSSIFVIDKDNSGNITTAKHYGFAFVPLKNKIE